MITALSFWDWVDVFTHFLALSLLSVGGAITTAPEMHRYFVVQKLWLNDSQFSSSIALAQAAPGPNVLFIAMIGWNLGLNAAGGIAAGPAAWPLAFVGACVSLLGIMLPSSTLTLAASRWGHKNKERREVRAFKQGMVPIVVALLASTGWLLASSEGTPLQAWRPWLLTAVVTLICWRTKVHLLWLLSAGGLLGWLGWV
jgi:chromate transporter